MRKLLPPLLIILIIASAFGVYWFKFRNASGKDDFKLYGNVEIREAEAAFRQSGRIKEIFVDEGSVVKQGDLLATLETDTFNQAIASANADIAVANAELSKLVDGSRPEEIALAEAGVRQAQAVLRNADEEFRRQSSLLASGSVSQKIVDNARAARDSAQANFDAARHTLALRRNGARKEDIASGRGRLQAASAGRDRLYTAREDTKLLAPIDGTIISRTKELGALITPQNTIFTISISNPIYVRAYASETQLGHLSPGTMVELKTDSSDKIYHGQVGFVSPRSEFTPKTVETEDLRSDLVYRLRIVVKDADRALLQGMPVTIEVPHQNQPAKK